MKRDVRKIEKIMAEDIDPLPLSSACRPYRECLKALCPSNALNPLSVLSRIQLSSLPRSQTGIHRPCLALLHAGRPFHSLPVISDSHPHCMSWIGYRFCSVAIHLWICLSASHSCLERGVSPGVPRDLPIDSRCVTI